MMNPCDEVDVVDHGFSQPQVAPLIAVCNALIGRGGEGRGDVKGPGWLFRLVLLLGLDVSCLSLVALVWFGIHSPTSALRNLKHVQRSTSCLSQSAFIQI